MKFKEIFLAFGVSGLLGYFYESGRLVVNGSTYESGYNYLDLNFDFGDYAHIGFYSNLYVFTSISTLILLVLLGLIYFIVFKLKSGIVEATIQSFFIFIYKKFINREGNITYKDVYNSKKETHAIRNLENDFFRKYILMSYFILIFGLIGMYTVLLTLINFDQLGVNKSRSEVLKQIRFINYKNQKLFKVVCGKAQCIYANKSYDFFKKIKEDNIEFNTLESIKYHTLEGKKFNFYHLSNKKINQLEKTVYIQVHSSNSSYDLRKFNPFNFYLFVQTSKQDSSLLKVKCYHHIQDEYTQHINHIKVKDSKKIPYFVAFKVPRDSSISFIEVVGPRSNHFQYDQCT